jgi:hypothetical protein
MPAQAGIQPSSPRKQGSRQKIDFLDSRLSDTVAIDKTLHIAVYVIPGLTRNQVLFKVLRYWMPDQVRHDRQKLSTLLLMTPSALRE